MDYISDIQGHIEKAVSHLHDELAKLQTGRASASLVEHIKVDSYGSLQPLKSVANITIPEPQSIAIQPWDRSTIQSIEKAIQASDLGFNPSNDGVTIRIAIPPLNEERRKELCKVAKKLAEEAKVSVRTARQGVLKQVQSSTALSEDEQKSFEKKIQDKVDEANKKVDEMLAHKEKDILTV